MAEIYLRLSRAVLEAVSILALASIALLNAINIFSRAVLHVDLEWTQEVSIIGAMVIYFYAISLISKGNADIRIEFVVQAMPASWQRGFGILARILLIAFQAAVLYLACSTLAFVSAFQTPVLQLPESIFFIPLIAGAADMLITESIYLLRQLRRRMPAPGGGMMI